jgi:hypothetical protein
MKTQAMAWCREVRVARITTVQSRRLAEGPIAAVRNTGKRKDRQEHGCKA